MASVYWIDFDERRRQETIFIPERRSQSDLVSRIKDSRTSRWKFQDDEVIFLLYVC